MKRNLLMKTGFTLIELLVVVLIIGILAAIALPQYQKAVAKSRASSMLPLLSSIAQARELHFLEYGEYPVGGEGVNDTIPLMDIQMPGSCARNIAGGHGNNTFACGSDFMIDFSNENGVSAWYCPGKNTNFTDCSGHAVYRIMKFQNHPESKYANDASQLRCNGKNTKGREVCTSLKLEGWD